VQRAKSKEQHRVEDREQEERGKCKWCADVQWWRAKSREAPSRTPLDCRCCNPCTEKESNKDMTQANRHALGKRHTKDDSKRKIKRRRQEQEQHAELIHEMHILILTN
jgi:MinD superfamily P-loop ATPase